MKVNRAANPEANMHTGGSVSFATHQFRLEKELKRLPTFQEVFDRTHKKKGTYQYISDRAREVAELYSQQMTEKYAGEDEQPQLDPEVWVAASGAPKKGHVYGFGHSMDTSKVLSGASISASQTRAFNTGVGAPGTSPSDMMGFITNTISGLESRIAQTMETRLVQIQTQVTDALQAQLSQSLSQVISQALSQRTLGVQQPSTLAKLLSIAQRHAACEESLAAGRAEQGESSDKKRPFDNGSDRDRKKGQRNGDSPCRPRPFTEYTPLTVAPEQILAEIREEPYVRWPPRMCSDPRRCNQDKFCRFHRDHGHDTSECRQLKDEIESLIKCGYLGGYVRRNENRARPREQTPDQPINNEPNGQEINVIAGGFGGGGESNQSQCDYARRVHVLDRAPASRLAPYPQNPCTRSEEVITFSDEDLVGVAIQHTDALVVSATINHCNVRRILIDNGSAPDVLAYDCFLLMGLKTDQLALV
ncbi:hypothetical protein Taro_022586 [Colocasia esculenta]|uniref:Reverse transcriptase domain-containing protein n=1 Tax=Colocasia esculenta TaxID=4460 RepID=A0A843V8D3_COLES|nr:hypothetical protein [Colocasia esculenta]